MTRAIIAVALCAIGVAGCGRSRDDVPEPVEQTGCLTGSEGQFVLTDLEGTAEGQPSATTETFALIGDDAELGQYVGKQVRVTGEAQPPSVAEARQVTPPEPAATSGEGEPQPQVSTQERTRVEVSRLRVASVTPTGDDCSEQLDPAPRG